MDISLLQAFLRSQNQPGYRFRQILKNYYSGRYLTFGEMTDLPLSLRTALDQKFPLLSVKESNLLTTPDSQKALLSLNDGQKIETVLLDYHDWLSVCASTQVGCPLACKFCATGKMGFKRNLTTEEIVDQVVYWKHHLVLSPFSQGEMRPKAERGLNRIAFMGMGEPFLNWDNLIEALKIINHDLKTGARKISISTAGIIPRIYDFANLNTEINLAVSLHSVEQKTRESIMPVAKQYPLTDLQKALNYYTFRTRRQLFLEYAPIKDVNDTPRHLKLLIEFLKSNQLYFLNLIPLNPVKNGLTPSSRLLQFESELKRSHLPYSLRHSLGRSTNSACGQLTVE